MEHSALGSWAPKSVPVRAVRAVNDHPVVAAQMSELPNVSGQSASGHGAGITSEPAASDAPRQS
jgi:hypothetical protein